MGEATRDGGDGAGERRPGVRAEHVDLGAYRAADRFDVWQNIAAPFFDVRALAPDRDAFTGSVTTLSFGEVIMVRSRLSGQGYERDGRRARVGPWDQIAFQLYCSGSFSADYDGRGVAVRTGDINTIDFTRPYRKASTDEADINLIVPRDMAARLCPNTSHGDVRPGGSPLGQLLALHLRMLAEQASAMTAEEAESVVKGFLLVLGGADLRGEDAGTKAGVRASARARAEAFIRANLRRADLGADAIAKGSGLSRAGLYRAFAADGGIRDVVLRARLDAAVDMIRRRPTAPFAAVAAACGLDGPRHLHDLLRRSHGLSPDDLRDGAGAGTVGTGGIVGPEGGSGTAAATPATWLDAMRRLRAA